MFAYTVQYGDTDGNGIYIAENDLFLNGGTIRSSGGTDAVLEYPRPGTQSGHKVDTAAVGNQVREVWAAQMTVRTSPQGQLGYGENYTGDSLTDNTFRTSAGDHTVHTVSIQRVQLTETRFTVTGSLPEVAEENWVLYLDDLRFNLGDARKQTWPNLTAYSWNQPVPGWQSGDEVDVALLAVNLTAEGAPIIRGAPRVGDVLTVDTSGITDPATAFPRTSSSPTSGSWPPETATRKSPAPRAPASPWTTPT